MNLVRARTEAHAQRLIDFYAVDVPDALVTVETFMHLFRQPDEALWFDTDIPCTVRVNAERENQRLNVVWGFPQTTPLDSFKPVMAACIRELERRFPTVVDWPIYCQSGSTTAHRLVLRQWQLALPAGVLERNAYNNWALTIPLSGDVAVNVEAGNTQRVRDAVDAAVLDGD